MSYYDTLDKNMYDFYGKSYSLFNPYSLDKKDILHSKIVASDLCSNYKKRNLDTSDNVISFQELITGAKEVFGYKGIGFNYLSGAVDSVLGSVEFTKGLSIYDFDFCVMSGIASNGNGYLKVPDSIRLPDYYSLDSIHFLAHEICHMLKELNPFECRGVYTDEEVIPIAIELISAYEKKDFGVFRKREYLMIDIIDLYKKLIKDKKEISEEDKVGFMSCYKKCIMYLNSFYNALRLFGRYLDDKESTIEYIEMVLAGQTTTRRLLDVLFIEDDSAYDIGFSEFKSKLI